MQFYAEPEGSPDLEVVARVLRRRRAGMRAALPFRSVNRRAAPDFTPGMQRHHLLPCELFASRGLRRFFDTLGGRPVFDDFRRNGLLLPASDDTARVLRLPLHRGPHPSYTRMVLDRVGTIEMHWSRHRLQRTDAALEDALFRLGILQQALRRRLLQPSGCRMVLNRRDPALAPDAFVELDAMAEMLWADVAGDERLHA